jgi:hypothetical protein
MTDLHVQVVTFAEGTALAAEFGGMPFFETSAKHNQNIEEMFLRIVGDIKNKLLADQGAGGSLGTDGGQKLPVGRPTGPKKGCC